MAQCDHCDRRATITASSGGQTWHFCDTCWRVKSAEESALAEDQRERELVRDFLLPLLNED